MLVTWQTIITAAAVVAAVVGIGKYYNRSYDWVKKQTEQDKQISAIMEEQTILTVGILACLKGLSEQGCDGPVTEAINKIEQHMIKKAHGG